MCGIAGLVGSSPVVAKRDDKVLLALQSALRHRGPDDSGIYVSPDGRAGLVHTRLSILDLSVSGHQPMSSPDGRYWITFNGEVYNFRALRAILEREGESFRTGTDTEVLLRLYMRRGPECVTELRGMFAFAIWDAVERSCFLARDQFGIKPLYYDTNVERLVFASEVRALLRSGIVPRKLDPAGAAGYFCFGSVQEPGTLVRDVRCVRAGHALLWCDGRVREWQHSKLIFNDQFDGNAADATSCIRSALEDSVEHHFVSDVPVGLFLSGGVDSTALLALATRKRGDLRTFCIRFAERKYDEGDLAQRTATHFRTNHADLTVDAREGQELFRSFIDRLDQPTIDGFNTFVVSKFAHESGMKVVLSGLGGDELFGGYPSFQRVPAMVRMGRRLQALGVLTGLAAGAMERFATKGSWRRVGQFMRTQPTLLNAYQAYRGIFTRVDAEGLARGYTGCPSARVAELESEEMQPTLEDALSALELSLYMRNQLLSDSDAMSMAWGLELRVPFLDQKLFAVLATLPSAMRLQAGKRLLLDAVPEVPPWIATRPKRGFTFPLADWLSGEWEPAFRGSGRSHGVRARTWYQKWAMFVFEHWCAEHGVA